MLHLLEGEFVGVGRFRDRFVVDGQHGLVARGIHAQKPFGEEIASDCLGDVFAVVNDQRAFLSEDDEPVAGAAVDEVVNLFVTSGLSNRRSLGQPCASL